MKNIFTILAIIVISNIAFSQPPKDGSVKFIGDSSYGSIMGFTNCENVNDSTCVPIKDQHGVLLHNYDGKVGHIWMFANDILELEFDFPGNESVTITDTSQIVIPEYPVVRDYCGGTHDDTDTTLNYTWISRLEPDKNRPEGTTWAELVYDKKWRLLKNDRDYIQPDTINIKKEFDIGRATYTFIYYDCLLTKHEWVYTYKFEPLINHKPRIYGVILY